MANIEQIRNIIMKVLGEAKKKEKAKKDARPDGYSYVEAFDYSQPLGALNLYRAQGASSFGPMTGTGAASHDRTLSKTYGDQGKVDVNEQFLRSFVRDVIRESVSMKDSVWRSYAETSTRYPRTIWEAALVEIDKAKCAQCGGKLDENFKCPKCSGKHKKI